MADTFRLYSDLAWLWPLWGDVDTEYADYSVRVTELIREYSLRPVTSLLVIGCGGGKNVYNLQLQGFKVTGLDISPTMLAQAAQLNPYASFVQADMRDFELAVQFDAILIDDAIAHLHSKDDLNAAFQAAYQHLAPGGVMIVTPDVTTENFQQNQSTSILAG